MIKKILILEGDLLFRNKVKTMLLEVYPTLIIDVFSSISATKVSQNISYDLVIMNYILPVVTGDEAIEFIKSKYNGLPVVTISDSNTKKIGGKPVEYHLNKPKNNDKENLNIFKKLLITIIEESKSSKREKISFEVTKKSIKEYKNRDFDLVLIACSTGGPRTIESVFEGIKKPNIPIAIVQHMPENFTKFFANSLSTRLGISFKEAVTGDEFDNSNIILAKGGSHLRFIKDKNKILINNDKVKEYVNSVRPSADVTFESVSKVFGINSKILILVLTGIGADGTKGIELLKESNSNITCITESKDSCVIYGMPKSVDTQGLSDYSMPKEDINRFLREVLN